MQHTYTSGIEDRIKRHKTRRVTGCKIAQIGKILRWNIRADRRIDTNFILWINFVYFVNECIWIKYSQFRDACSVGFTTKTCEWLHIMILQYAKKHKFTKRDVGLLHYEHTLRIALLILKSHIVEFKHLYRCLQGLLIILLIWLICCFFIYSFIQNWVTAFRFY